jgi:hypothetical protein
MSRQLMGERAPAKNAEGMKKSCGKDLAGAWAKLWACPNPPELEDEGMALTHEDVLQRC